MSYYSAAAISRPEISDILMEVQTDELSKLFIGTQVLGIQTVKARAGRYPKVTIKNGNLLKTGGDLRGPTGSYNRIDQATEWDTYDCQERGNEQRIDDSIKEEMSDYFDAEVMAAKNVQGYIMRGHEVRIASLVQDPTATGFTSTDAVVALTEANLATIDISQDIINAELRLLKYGVKPNACVMSREVWNRIRRSDRLQKFLYGNLPGLGNKDITPDAFQGVFGFKLFIGDCFVDTAPMGADPTMSAAWNNNYILLAKVAGGAFNAGGIGRVLVWEGDSNGLYTSESYREDNTRGNVVRTRMFAVEKIVNPLHGQLIKTNWA
jgi:hypothetical protein